MSQNIHTFRVYSRRVRRNFNEIAASFLLTLAAVGFLIVAWFGGHSQESRLGNASAIELPRPQLR